MAVKHKGLSGILLFYHVDTLDFICALFSLSWGIWLLSPFWSVFDSVPQTYNSFVHLSRYVIDGLPAEETWGIFAIGVGLLRLYATLKEKKRTNYIATILSFVMWMTIGSLYLYANFSAVGGILSLTIASSSALSFLHHQALST